MWQTIEQLRFLRPEWFLAFVPLLLFVALMLRRRVASLAWKAVCDAPLLPHILTDGNHKTSRVPLLLVFIAASLAIVAAAGPVVEKLPQPVFREQSALVILLDLSRSMDATDVKPSRLQRAKLKLLDILKLRKTGQTALVVYAADAFVVTPLTDDTNTIASLVPSLDSGIMPGQGSNAWRAIETAMELLKQSGATAGNVLLIADSIGNRDIESIENLKANGHRLSILGIGTPAGGPVPVKGGFLQDSSGAIVIPRLNPAELQRAALGGGGLYVGMRADDADIERLNKLFTADRMTPGVDEHTLGETDIRADTWKEEGPWLLLLLIPLAALGMRKGWFLCLPLLVLPVAEPGHAMELDQLWSRPDQQAMRAFEQGDATAAAELFENEEWKASAYYRAGDYQRALELLDEAASSDAYYNRGNALAKLGHYPEAMQAYDEALKLDSDNADAAYNRQLVEQAMQKQQHDGQQNNKQNGADNEQQQNQDAANRKPDNADKDSSEQASSDQDSSQDSGQPKQESHPDSTQPDADQQQTRNQGEANDEKIEQAMQAAREREQASAQETPGQTETGRDDSRDEAPEQQMAMNRDEDGSEQDQVIEQWLKRVPDDPGELLRRKFYYQYRRMPEQTPSDEQW